jgi:DNA-binding XRE family transcriptional regulator
MQSNHFGKVLNYLRESKFISKTKLAKEIIVSRQLLATLESGDSVPNEVC